MSRKKKIIIIILLVAIGVLFLYLSTRNPSIGPEEDVYIPPPEIDEPLSAGETPAELTPEDQAKRAVETQESAVRKNAIVFAEKFGSFSNKNDYENLKDLKYMMTDRMIAWADSYMAKNPKDGFGVSEYEGTTTKALSINISEMDIDAGTANVTVQTQRQEFSGSTSNSKVVYQNIELVFIKQAGQWKVDAASWK